MALAGEIPPMALPRGPERLTPDFASSPNWTLLSRAADYVIGDRYNASAALEWRAKGELEGPLGFMLHEPHTRNYSRKHYSGWRAVYHYASRRDPELANMALLWLHHFHLMRCAAFLPWGPPARKKGASRCWGGITDCMPGQRTKEVHWLESSIEPVVGEVTGLGQANRQRISRNRMMMQFRDVYPLGIGNELSKSQRDELRALITEGRLPTGFSDLIYSVPLRVNLHIIRTENGCLAWMNKKIADKPALLVVRAEKGQETEYGQGRVTEFKNGQVELDSGRKFSVPSGKTLFELSQDRDGVHAEQGQAKVAVEQTCDCE